MTYLRLVGAIILLAVAAAALAAALLFGFGDCPSGMAVAEHRVPYCGHPYTPVA